jgi:hypothetical protein
MEISEFEVLVKNIENFRDEFLMGEYRNIFESYTQGVDRKIFLEQAFGNFSEWHFGLGFADRSGDL